MLVLAPDPRLGIAPDRVARVRALLENARSTGGAASVPGVVVALPGGPDGVLDAIVLRPDGVLGLVPAPARVAAGSGADASAEADSGDADDELARLLGLPDPPVAAPRRALPAAEHPPEETRSALVAPVGPSRVLEATDVRRILDAFRLGEHAPDAGELAGAGFPETPPGAGPDDGETAALPAVAEEAPAIPRARSAGSVPSAGSSRASTRSSSTTGSSPASRSSSSLPSSRSSGSPRPRSASPSLPPVPVTEPVPRVDSNPERDGVAASFPGTGALALDPSHARRRALPNWVWGWPGLLVAALAVFLVALGVAFGIGRLVGGPSTDASGSAAGAVSRTLGGTSFARRDAALDSTCEGHAYGRVVAFVRDHPCTRLERSLWTGTVGGRQTLVAVATVQMGDPASAAALKSMVDTSGTGNIAELVREHSYPGAPSSFSSAGYASRLLGDRVVISEADSADPSFTDSATLNRIASEGLGLP